MSFVFNPNRDKCLFSYSQHIENWFCFRRVIWSFHEHTCFSRLKRLRDFVYRRFNFSPTFREEREKIRHFGFYSKEIYYWLSINTSSSTFMRGAGGCILWIRKPVPQAVAIFHLLWPEQPASFWQPCPSLLHGTAKHESDTHVHCLPIPCVQVHMTWLTV